MRIIVYNSSSFGGCFDYGRELLEAYQARPEIESCEWWIPANAEVPESHGVRKLFLNDKPAISSRLLRQLHFLYRVFLNPFILYFRLAAAPPSLVILNDFEQLTAPIWTPFFRWTLASRHRFILILHDPDRDAYPPSLRWTIFSMKALTGLADLAFYHNYLPEKTYYTDNGKCRYFDIPHGVFRMPSPDQAFHQLIKEKNKAGNKIMSIPGNIRHEKNYETAIEALSLLPEYSLLIAGAASSARVSVDSYRQLAEKLGVSDRVIWMEHYLSPAELTAVMQVSDVVVLNYSDSFTSQSGILNVAAPFKKPLVVSDGRSSLASVVRRFGMGILVSGNGASGLSEAVRSAVETASEKKLAWDAYLEYASWERHADTAIQIFKEIS
jgi:glycosyltransferase involved in cell wall biosynthesis